MRTRNCETAYLQDKATGGKAWFPSCSFTFILNFIAGPSRTPVLKVTNFRSSFGQLPKIPILELVANKIGDTFLDYRVFQLIWFKFCDLFA